MCMSGIRIRKKTSDWVASATALDREPRCLPVPFSRVRLQRMCARDSRENKAGATAD